MMDAMLTALEKALVGFTYACKFCSRAQSSLTCLYYLRLWNYNPYNTDEHGDDWNGENFSWFSRSRAAPPAQLSYEQTSGELDNGGRILASIVRPYAAKTAGIPLRFEYEVNTGKLAYEWVSPDESASTSGSSSVFEPPRSLNHPLISRETEIFLPAQLTRSRSVVVTGLDKGDTWVHDEARQSLFIVTQDVSPGARHKVDVSVDPPPKPYFVVNDIWSDYGVVMYSIMAFVLAFVCYLYSGLYL